MNKSNLKRAVNRAIRYYAHDYINQYGELRDRDQFILYVKQLVQLRRNRLFDIREDIFVNEYISSLLK